MKMLYTRSRKHKPYPVIVDDDIYEDIKDKYLWINHSRGKIRSVRVSSPGDKSGEALSNFIMKPKKGEVVDHISRDPLDNRRSNLRICNYLDNLRNKPLQKNNSSGIPSVRKVNNKWRVRIKYMYTKIHIGYFDTKEEAGYVRDQVILQLHGDFAQTYII